MNIKNVANNEHKNVANNELFVCANNEHKKYCQ